MQNSAEILETGRDTTFFPLLPKANFFEAKNEIFGFSSWDDYDSYRIETEGYYFGMISAGLSANLVSLNFLTFKSWAMHTSEKMTARNLYEFARIVAIARDNPIKTIRALCDDSKVAVRLKSGLGEATTYVLFAFFRHWQSTSSFLRLGGAPLAPEEYCHLLLELWTEAA